jgi:hypothetical protein
VQAFFIENEINRENDFPLLRLENVLMYLTTSVKHFSYFLRNFLRQRDEMHLLPNPSQLNGVIKTSIKFDFLMFVIRTFICTADGD